MSKSLVITRGLLARALQRSGLLPRGAQIISRGSPDDPVLNVCYEVGEADVLEMGGDADRISLNDARQYVLERREDGVLCPACDRFVLVYKRLLNKTMAVTFAKLVDIHLRENKREVHAHEVCKPTLGRDFSQLKFWGLMEQLPKKEGQKGRTSGWWAPTPRGVEWAHSKINIPKYRIHVSGEKTTLGWSDEKIYIQDALPEDFDYTKLLEDGAAIGALDL